MSVTLHENLTVTAIIVCLHLPKSNQNTGYNPLGNFEYGNSKPDRHVSPLKP